MDGSSHISLFHKRMPRGLTLTSSRKDSPRTLIIWLRRLARQIASTEAA